MPTGGKQGGGDCRLEGGCPPFKKLRMNTWVGHKIRAVVSREGTAVSEFVMKAGWREYRIRLGGEGMTQATKSSEP